MDNIRLLVKSEQDEPFLLQLYELNRQQEVSLWGWSEEQIKPFMTMQYHMQQHYYAQQYAHSEYFIIMDRETPIGKFQFDKAGSDWTIVDIAILPEYHNRGIGTWMIKQFLFEASQQNKAVQLSVLNTNPARSLYERLGFQVFDSGEVYTRMRVGGEG